MVFVRDVFGGEARKVEGSGLPGCRHGKPAQPGLCVGRLEWLARHCLRVESRGLAQDSEDSLAAPRGSRESGREAEQDRAFQPHSHVLWTLGDELLSLVV